LAARAWVEDLGKVEVSIGQRRVDASQVRRKVLALLCILLTRAKFSAGREDVMERLWPDLEPDTALNSLNQTVYFLRRLFEPEYKEDTSPVYVAQDSETIWMDPELVDSRSARCRAIIHGLPTVPSPVDVDRLVAEYRAQFALDFPYEEWASSYRDSLHAAYLRVVENAIRADIASGDYLRGIRVAESAMAVEPDADAIQGALVRLYRLAGVHSAAAEQYEQYASTLRGLGVTAPPIEEV
jgi:DNA-binding SARP family transcriptional activator